MPGSEFSVARTATRANASDYFVDGKKAPVKDVAALLKGKGIDLDNNRFLILQVRAGGGGRWERRPGGFLGGRAAEGAGGSGVLATTRAELPLLSSPRTTHRAITPTANRARSSRSRSCGP